jgi:hypothetical protein
MTCDIKRPHQNLLAGVLDAQNDPLTHASMHAKIMQLAFATAFPLERLIHAARPEQPRRVL